MDIGSVVELEHEATKQRLPHRFVIHQASQNAVVLALDQPGPMQCLYLQQGQVGFDGDMDDVRRGTARFVPTYHKLRWPLAADADFDGAGDSGNAGGGGHAEAGTGGASQERAATAPVPARETHRGAAAQQATQAAGPMPAGPMPEASVTLRSCYEGSMNALAEADAAACCSYLAMKGGKLVGAPTDDPAACRWRVREVRVPPAALPTLPLVAALAEE